MMRVTKPDGDGKIFEIDDAPDSVAAAAKKGYVPVIEMSKDGQTWHDVIGTEDSITAAIGKGYKARPAKGPQESYSKTESFLRGGAAGASFDFDDEAGGVAGSLIGKLPFAPDELKGKSYEEVRDRIRAQKKGASEENPWSYMGGSLAGSMALPMGAGAGAKTVAGAVGKGILTGGVTGTIQGLGESEADNAGDMTLDALAGGGKGAVLGGLFGGAANVGSRALASGANKAAGLTAKGLDSLADSLPDSSSLGRKLKSSAGKLENFDALERIGQRSLSDEWKDFKIGTGKEITEFSPGFDQARRVVNGIKNTFAAASNDDAVRQMAQNFRKHVGPGHFRDMSDRAVIVSMADEGNEQAMRFIAGQSALATGANEDDLFQLMKAGATERQKARNFDFDEAGGELLGPAEKLSKGLGKAAGERVGTLNNEARAAYDMDRNSPIKTIEHLQKLSDMAEEHGEAVVGKKKFIDAALNVLKNGSSTIEGLSKRPWNEIDSQEMYDRLRFARTMMGENLEWAKANNAATAQAKALGAYDSITKTLKFDERQTESDRVWSAYKDLQKALISKMQFDGDINKYKIGEKLRDNFSAKNFRDALDDLGEFLKTPGLPEEIKADAQKFQGLFEKHLSTAELRRRIQGFEKDVRGVSGQAVERASSLARGDDALAERIKAPAQGLLSQEAAQRAAEKFFGKPWSQLGREERMLTLKYQNAIKIKPDMTFAEAAAKWGDLKKSGGR